ncbi:hypothetical protein ILUMI_07722 [Ignelater luminosus]|uniref:Uncharacterized protein n=1 Tax=Ignelater luminosus TaxID=2038154 RepID=A0A8K0GE41_IGNLU|nr:hypothetical protein ILUMI_07722 [Ignelater luminosus]
MSTSSSSKEELGPKSRTRSSSATESSKPIARRQTHSGMSKYHTQDTNPQVTETQVPASTSATHIAVSWVSCMYQHLYHRGASRASQRRHSISGTAGRERCDSMPSRARTSSEGTHPIHTWAQSRSYLAPHRPQSLYVREISHSPPAESPVSPPSAACSTDSAGSSLSIDDSEQWPETDTILGRYGHSLTPDEAIAEENYDECPDSPCLPQGTSPSGYLPMAPISSDDGYVDMSPRGRHTTMSPAASTSSITSGTPSTDMRFAEYPLEKVSAYFTPSEEETSSTERPIRAYSVGSRPETIKNKSRIEMSTTPENSRVRAFSVGSKTRKIHTRVLHPTHTHSDHGKSSSAPLLSSSRILASHNSDDPMNDLMEMDFSKPANSGYMDMTPSNKVPSGYVEMRPGFHDAAHNTQDVSPYVDMRSGSSPAKPSFINQSQPDYVPIQQAVKINSQEYVDMDPCRARSNTSLQNIRNPSSPMASSKPWRHTDYMDMSFQTKNNKPERQNTYSTSPKYPDDSPMDGSMDYMDMAFNSNSGRTVLESKPTTKDGYVEMSLGKSSSHHRQSSLDSNRISSDGNDDYTNMSMGSSRKKERKGSKKDKTRSQPIQIQTTTASSQFLKSSSSISPVYSSLQIGRKYSTGTPPKMYLPLSNSGSDSYSSLPRQRSRKNSRRDSKDSSSSSLTTPSSSSTIFPISLNSPSSPLKPCNATKSPEVSSNIKIPPAIINVKYNRPSFSQIDKTHNSDYTVMDFDKSKTTSDVKSSTESDYVNYNPSISNLAKYGRPEPSGDYAIMRPGTLDVTRSIPATEPKITIPVSSPSALTTQLSSMVLGKCPFSYDFSMGGTRCFIPISEAKDDPRLGTMSPKPGDLAPTKSTENVRNIENASSEEVDCAYEAPHSGECLSPVAKISRPNSVNSDKIGKNNSRPASVSSDKSRPASVSSEITRASLSRPSSASSELGSSSSTIVGSRPPSVNSDRIRPASVNIEGQLHYASLDLAPTCEEEGNRSPRTVKTVGETTNTSPTQALPETGFTYAEIDFVKSEGFKHNALPSNTKVKH